MHHRITTQLWLHHYKRWPDGQHNFRRTYYLLFYHHQIDKSSIFDRTRLEWSCI